jgi:23S rRNA (guanosine2251-2'-O)-methyltransferase
VRNFGAIARSAYCGGVHAIVVPDAGAAQVTEDAIKTSAGALLKIPVCRETNMKTTMELLNQSGVTTVACSEKANKDFPYIDLPVPLPSFWARKKTGSQMILSEELHTWPKFQWKWALGRLMFLWQQVLLYMKQ